MIHYLQHFETSVKCVKSEVKRNLFRTFLKPLNIYLFSKIFQKVEIVKLRRNILQYLTKMLRQYFSCNERLKIFLTCFCNILCYVGNALEAYLRTVEIYKFFLYHILLLLLLFLIRDK